MSHWNYRVIEFTDTDGSRYFEIKEVHYEDDGRPYGFGSATLMWTESDGRLAPHEMLANMQHALAKPVIKREDFPDGGNDE